MRATPLLEKGTLGGLMLGSSPSSRASGKAGARPSQPSALPAAGAATADARNHLMPSAKSSGNRQGCRLTTSDAGMPPC